MLNAPVTIPIRNYLHSNIDFFLSLIDNKHLISYSFIIERKNKTKEIKQNLVIFLIQYNISYLLLVLS